MCKLCFGMKWDLYVVGFFKIEMFNIIFVCKELIFNCFLCDLINNFRNFVDLNKKVNEFWIIKNS